MMSTPRTIHIVSLGCPKNRVDSERMLAIAESQGLTPIADPAESDVILVNTCGFINAAKKESIDTLLELAQYKQDGKCQSLVMAGCLAQRYSTDLAGQLPEVDHFIGTADFTKLADILAKSAAARLSVGKPDNLSEQEYGRKLIGSAHSAYLKISEGCNRPCAFCIIPAMRGRQRSRTIESLVAEARSLTSQGVTELILVAQDSTAYGRDLGRDSGQNLPELLYALNQIDALRWIRLHYAYPTAVTPALVNAMAACDKVAPYIDMPIQHADDDVLRRMRRGYSGARVKDTIALLRDKIPHIAIRTTFLVGHPGETDASFAQLLGFVEEQKLDHVGVFPFSSEEGTHAHEQPDTVPSAVANKRRNAIMRLQKRISKNKLKSYKGKELLVLVDGPHPDSEFLWQGRHAGQSPDIDGSIILTDGAPTPGSYVHATVTQTGDYDLVASLN